MKLKALTVLGIAMALTGCGKSVEEIQAMRVEAHPQLPNLEPKLVYGNFNINTMEEAEKFFIAMVDINKEMFEAQMDGKIDPVAHVNRCYSQFRNLTMPRNTIKEICFILASGGHVEVKDYLDEWKEYTQPRIDAERMSLCASDYYKFID